MYMNVFRSRKRDDMDKAAYAADDEHMVALAAVQPGFVSFKYYLAPDGETVAISIWESEEHARQWGKRPEHALVQARGRSDYYESYTMFVCLDPAVSNFTRITA
ncbi:MAG: antibiotic biosynthesis monooxygenase [Novosphingobium sp.]